MPDQDVKTLGEELPREMARVRDEVIPAYEACGPGGKPGLFLMRMELDAATKALAEGDVVTMLRAYEALKGWKL